MDKIIPYSSKRVGWPEWPECLNCFRRRSSSLEDQLLSPGSSQDNTDTPGLAKNYRRPGSTESSPMTSPTGKETKEQLLERATTIIKSLVSEENRESFLKLFKYRKAVLTHEIVKDYISYRSFNETNINELISLHIRYHDLK